MFIIRLQYMLNDINILSEFEKAGEGKIMQSHVNQPLGKNEKTFVVRWFTIRFAVLPLRQITFLHLISLDLSQYYYLTNNKKAQTLNTLYNFEKTICGLHLKRHEYF